MPGAAIGSHFGNHTSADSINVKGVRRRKRVNRLPNLTFLNHIVDELVAFAEGTCALNPKIQREGVVLRPLADRERLRELVEGRALTHDSMDVTRVRQFRLVRQVES
jgi:hypothetical protein